MAKNTNSIGIIPARFSSSRFPGKPLVEIQGKSMIRRVYEQVLQSRMLDTVVVATDDERIYDHVKAFHGRVVMTSPFHKSGTERCAEVIAQSAYEDYELIVNIQGDEPFIDPGQIDQLTGFLPRQPAFQIASLCRKITETADLLNPGVVKVVMGADSKALYFSRSPVPYLRDLPTEEWVSAGIHYKHIGLYAFRKETLLQVAQSPAGRLEVAESLEQLRWLEQGIAIGMSVTDLDTIGIDTPEDLERANRRP